MEFLYSIWEGIKFIVNPENIIVWGGMPLLVAVIFAETGLLVGFFLPGDSLLFLAGLYCGLDKFENKYIGTGMVSIYELLLFVTIAAVVGDQVGYIIGKRMGPAVFKQKQSWLFKPEYVIMTKSFYDRHGGKALVLGRFLPIIRTFAPVLAGVVQLEYRKFVFFNISGGILWVFLMSLAGFFLGQQFPGIYHYITYIVVGMIVLSAVPVIKTFFSERKLMSDKANQEKLKERDKMLEEMEKEREEHKKHNH